jgi:hypothetical protein
LPRGVNPWINPSGLPPPPPRLIPESPPTININSLIKAAAEKPDAYVRELALPYGCQAVAVFNALKKHLITYKKNLYVP